tara:strand:- start:953 stop:2110 length:1158 start_codon:yes stop_codon:yes gene_type:complete
MKKTVYYWSPCLTHVGTIKSTLNSSIALAKYNSNYEVILLNVFGEWTVYKKYLNEKGIRVINLTFNFKNLLPKYGFFQSRFSYILIFLISFIPLLILLKKNKPDFIIAHLITSLPIFLFKLFNFNTKLILRISGMPKLHFIRKIFWNLSSKNIHSVTCPTLELKKKIEKLNIFTISNIYFLPDAVINISNFKEQLNTKNKYENIFSKNNKTILAAGRLTKQKNFSYLIDEFSKFCLEFKDYKLIILGDGEEYESLKKKTKQKSMDNFIFLVGRVDNVFRYMKDSDLFVLCSKWEEMGFVMIEAALSNLFIISSNCPNGPSEFLNYGKNGILFQNNKKNALYDSLVRFHGIDKKKKFEDKIKIKKNSMKYSMFRHYQYLKQILLNN